MASVDLARHRPGRRDREIRGVAALRRPGRHFSAIRHVEGLDPGLVRQKPLTALLLPFWVLRGKAAFKAEIANSVTLDVAKLRYNRPLLEFLKAQHAAGRAIYLATAADAKTAKAIAEHVGLFTATLASDGSTNLAGEKKLAVFRAKFPQGFCYIGNAPPDLPILAVCSEPMVANPWRSLLRAMRRAGIVPVWSFIDK